MPEPSQSDPTCRFCGTPLEHVFADLGMSPDANAYVTQDRLAASAAFFPLCAYVCGRCFLVQLEVFETAEEHFADYAYFSSYSVTWLEHARTYSEAIIQRRGLGPESKVVEVASNDGYLLRNFVAAGIPALGVEPAANVAAVAQEQGVPTVVRFFGRETALALREEHRADLIVGNNVLAHVPDINDFVSGLAVLLKPEGAVTMEFPHLLRLIEEVQFDTIYHEHFSYLSLGTVARVLEAHELRLFDVEEVPTHGGSLRVFVCHRESVEPVSERVTDLLREEDEAGLGRIETYLEFGERVKRQKRAILSFLIEAKERGASVVGYGAPAKGNTLLNYCGIGRDFLDYTVDRSPHKQGCSLPGTLIPIRAPEEIERTRPDYVFILPWNLRDEVMDQMRVVREWGGKFVVPVPSLQIFE